MNTIYAEEKFMQAERALAIGRDSIKGRLLDAYRCFAPLTEDDLPVDMRSEFQWILQKLTKRPPLKGKGTETIISGSVSQTLHFMKNKTAQSIAERIVDLRSRLKSYNDENVRNVK